MIIVFLLFFGPLVWRPMAPVIWPDCGLQQVIPVFLQFVS